MQRLTPYLFLAVLAFTSCAKRDTGPGTIVAVIQSDPYPKETLEREDDATKKNETPAEESTRRVQRSDEVFVDREGRTRMFVVTASTSRCPTPAGALARDCGNTVEDGAMGYREGKGEVIWVEGEARDGVFATRRYTKDGVLPGWVAAADLAPKPDLRELEEFRRRASDRALELDPDRLPESGEVAFTGSLHVPIRLVTTPSPSGERVPVQPVTFLLDFPAENEGPPATIAVEFPDCLKVAGGDSPFFVSHDCLMHADCGDLEYVCDEAYCDRVSFVAEVTERSIEAPGWDGEPFAFPVLTVVEWADRLVRVDDTRCEE